MRWGTRPTSGPTITMDCGMYPSCRYREHRKRSIRGRERRTHRAALEVCLSFGGMVAKTKTEPMTPGNMRQLRQEGARPARALAMPLTSDRWIQRCYSAHLISVGQFLNGLLRSCPAGRRGRWGLRCPAVRWRCESGPAWLHKRLAFEF